MAWELFYKSAVRLGDWKAVHSRDDRGRPNDPDQKWSWKLYNLKSDPGERANVLSDNPEEFARLMRVWDVYVEENGVVRRGEGAPE
jgi:arylsulfatase